MTAKHIADITPTRPGFGTNAGRNKAKALEQSAPALFAIVKEFGESDEGKAILRSYGSPEKPAPLLSLGIVKLWELIQQTSPSGAEAAEKAFDRTYSGWCRYGLEPDAAFLNRICELCLAKAAAASSSVDQNGAPNSTAESSP